MIELGAGTLPTIERVTTFAFRAETCGGVIDRFRSRIVGRMATHTAGRQSDELSARSASMTGLTRRLGMCTRQRKSVLVLAN
jgi:hypothetical protein